VVVKPGGKKMASLAELLGLVGPKNQAEQRIPEEGNKVAELLGNEGPQENAKVAELLEKQELLGDGNKVGELLAGEAPQELKQEGPKFEIPDLTEVHLTEYTYQKAFRYAALVMQRKGWNVEVGGFLTQPKEAKDRIARDAFLARDQEVGVGHYELNPEDVVKAGRELDQKGQRILGWWHSHGRLQTFHSPTDDRNQMVVLNGISPSNYISVMRERRFDGLETDVWGEEAAMVNPQDPGRRFKLKVKGVSPEFAASQLEIFEEQRIGFAYSFVVNHPFWKRHHVPYFEISTRDLCSTCLNPQDVSVKGAGCRVFRDGEYTIYNDELRDEIDERVYRAGGKK